MSEKVKFVINPRAVSAFLLGLFTANNIIYCFVVGATPIMLVNVYATICLVIAAIKNPRKVSRAVMFITKDLRLLFLYITCSIFAMWAAESRYFSVGWSGYINLILNVIVLLMTIVYADHLDSLIKGIFVGIIVNFIFVIIAFLLYGAGIPFSLNELFPAIPSFAVQSLSRTFRPRGLFREPGHLIRYMAVFTLIAWEHIKNGKKLSKWIFLIGSLLVLAISRSSAVAMFLIALLAYGLAMLSYNGGLNRHSAFYALLGVIGVGVFFVFGGGLLDSLISGVTDFSLEDVGNQGRIMGMNSTIEVIKSNSLFGSGWNSLMSRLVEDGFVNKYVQGSYSVALRVISDIGIGAAFYFYFLINKTYKLFKQKDGSATVATAAALLSYILLFISTDYAMDGSIAVLFGIVLITISRRSIAGRNQKNEAH